MRTVAIIPTVAGLAVVLAACREHTPEPVPTEPAPEVRQLAALSQTDMGTREEREARAPYSPVWWPQDVGDIVSGQRSHDLELAGSWNGLSAVFWVDTLAFVPVFSTVWPDGEPVPTGAMYEGHFPRKSHNDPDGYWTEWWDDWPAHLEGQDSADVKRWLYDPAFRHTSRGATEAEKAIWTRARWLEGWRGPGTEGGNE